MSCEGLGLKFISTIAGLTCLNQLTGKCPQKINRLNVWKTADLVLPLLRLWLKKTAKASENKSQKCSWKMLTLVHLLLCSRTSKVWKKPCSPPRFVFRTVEKVARCFLTDLCARNPRKCGILVRLDGQKTAVYVRLWWKNSSIFKLLILWWRAVFGWLKPIGGRWWKWICT